MCNPTHAHYLLCVRVVCEKMSYQVCGHCHQLLSEKTLKEHRRLYCDNEKGTWTEITAEDCDTSQASFPLCVSPPGTEGDSQLDVESVEEDEVRTLPSSDEGPFNEEGSDGSVPSTYHDQKFLLLVIIILFV